MARNRSPSAHTPSGWPSLRTWPIESVDAPVRRDTLLALFWPELGDQEARRALRQALHYLRRVVAEDVFVTTGDVIASRAEALRCDAVDLERLIASGQNAKGLELYRGDFAMAFTSPTLRPTSRSGLRARVLVSGTAPRPPPGPSPMPPWPHPMPNGQLASRGRPARCRPTPRSAGGDSWRCSSASVTSKERFVRSTSSRAVCGRNWTPNRRTGPPDQTRARTRTRRDPPVVRA